MNKDKKIIHPDSPGIEVVFFSCLVLTIFNAVLIFIDWRTIIVMIPAAVWGMTFLLLILRHRRTYFHSDDIKPFPIAEEKMKDTKGRLLFHAPRPPLRANRREEYRQVCQDYLDYKQNHPEDVPDWHVAQEIGVGKTKLFEALQAWRLGELDDRPWSKRVWDRVNGRARSDSTRYLPSP